MPLFKIFLLNHPLFAKKCLQIFVNYDKIEKNDLMKTNVQSGMREGEYMSIVVSAFCCAVFSHIIAIYCMRLVL